MYIGFIAIDTDAFILKCQIYAKEFSILSIKSLNLKPCDNKYIPDLCFPLEVIENTEISTISMEFIIKLELNAEIHKFSINLNDFLAQHPETDEIRIGIDSKAQVYIWLYSYYNCVLIDTPNYNHVCQELKQFNYRYVLDIGRYANHNAGFSDIEEKLFDGSHDKLHNGSLLNYHNTGIPEKLKVTLDDNVSNWSLFLWFDKSEIFKFFQKFYGAHPETKTDFIIRIDAENKKYVLALYRQRLKEPVVIPESAYQLIVFKNKFEDYRSENYNQPRGAWIW